jgi:hypothetical protein
MRPILCLFTLLAAIAALPLPLSATSFELRFDLLAKPLSALTPEQRVQVDHSIGLIKHGEHTRALAVLSDSNKQASHAGIQVITAYALLNSATSWALLARQCGRKDHR